MNNKYQNLLNLKNLKRKLRNHYKSVFPEQPDTDAEWIKLHNSIKIAENRNKRPEEKIRENKYASLPRFAFAAAVVVILITGYFGFNLLLHDAGSYITKSEEQKTVNLDDGSQIILNSGSELTVSGEFNKRDRLVELKGEAYFKVRKGNFPFTVKTDFASIKVVGTEFNVKSRVKQFEVAVNRGTVNVLTKNDKIVVLSKGDLITSDKNELPDVPKQVEYESYPGWIHGEFIFISTRLDNVVEEIERRFNVKIEIKDENLKNETITGLFKEKDPGTILKTLAEITEKEFKYENEKYIIY